MKIISWLLIIGAATGMGFLFWRWRRKEEERRLASEARLASLMAQALPAMAQATPAAQPIAQTANASTLAQQKLLLEAASKAGEAGEAALSIQLYARLLARYPDSSFAGPARTAAEEQKKKLARL